MDVVNALMNTLLPVPGYGAIAKISKTGLDPPHNLDSLTNIYCYMDDVITAVHGDMERQQQVFVGTV